MTKEDISDIFVNYVCVTVTMCVQMWIHLSPGVSDCVFCIISCSLYGCFGSALNYLSCDSFILGFTASSLRWREVRAIMIKEQHAHQCDATQKELCIQQSRYSMSNLEIILSGPSDCKDSSYSSLQCSPTLQTCKAVNFSPSLKLFKLHHCTEK